MGKLANKMIYVRLKGGLGNQMFQYAAGKSLAMMLNRELRVDLSFLKKKEQFHNQEFVKREYELSIFKNINEKTTIVENLNGNKILLKAINVFNSLRFKRFFEKSLNFDPLYFNLKPPILIEGYWQDEQYFKMIESEIRNKFIFPEIIIDDVNSNISFEINTKNSIAIHVRRSDYLTKFNFGTHGVCNIIYYKNAIKYIQQKVQNPTFYFFSDDHDWVKHELLHLVEESKVVEGNYGKDAWKDMKLMSLCKHNIIANSSFSWWGAWLNTNPEKIVIAPKQWFADTKMNEQSTSIIPKEWIRI